MRAHYVTRNLRIARRYAKTAGMPERRYFHLAGMRVSMMSVRIFTAYCRFTCSRAKGEI